MSVLAALQRPPRVTSGSQCFTVIRPHCSTRELRSMLEKQHCSKRLNQLSRGRQIPTDLLHPTAATLKSLEFIFNDNDIPWSPHSSDVFEIINRLSVIMGYVVVLEIISTLEPHPIVVEMDGYEDPDQAANVNEVADRVMLGISNTSPNVTAVAGEGGMTGAGRKGTNVSVLQMRKSERIRSLTNQYMPLLIDLHAQMIHITQDHLNSLKWYLGTRVVPLLDLTQRQKRLDNMWLQVDGELLQSMLETRAQNVKTLFTPQNTTTDATEITRERKKFLNKAVGLYTQVIEKTPPLVCRKSDKLEIVITNYGGEYTLTNYSGDVLDYMIYSEDRFYTSSAITKSGSSSLKNDPHNYFLLQFGEEEQEWGGATRGKKNATKHDFITKHESFLSRLLPLEIQHRFIERNRNVQLIKRQTQTLIVVRSLDDEEIYKKKMEMGANEAQGKNPGIKLPTLVTNEYLDSEIKKIEKRTNQNAKKISPEMRRALQGLPTASAFMENCAEDIDAEGEEYTDPLATPGPSAKEMLKDQDIEDRINALNQAIACGVSTDRTKTAKGRMGEPQHSQYTFAPGATKAGIPSAMDLATSVSDPDARPTKSLKRSLDEINMQKTIAKQQKLIGSLEGQVKSLNEEHTNLTHKLHSLSLQVKIKSLTNTKMKSNLQKLDETKKQMELVAQDRGKVIEQMRDLLQELLKKCNMTRDERDIYMGMLSKEMSTGGRSGVANAFGFNHLDTVSAIQSLYRVMATRYTPSGVPNKKMRLSSEFDPINTMSPNSIELLLTELDIYSKPVFHHTLTRTDMEFNNSLMEETWMHDRLVDARFTEANPIHKTPSNVIMDTVHLKMIDVNPVAPKITEMTSSDGVSGAADVIENIGNAMDHKRAPAPKYINAKFPTDGATSNSNLEMQWSEELKREFRLITDSYTKNGMKISGYCSTLTIEKFVIPYLKMTFGHIMDFTRATRYICLIPSLERNFKAGLYDGSLQGLLDSYFNSRVIVKT